MDTALLPVFKPRSIRERGDIRMGFPVLNCSNDSHLIAANFGLVLGLVFHVGFYHRYSAVLA